MEQLITALNTTLEQPTPHCSPILNRKDLKQASGKLFNTTNIIHEIYSSQFTLNDIKIILGTDDFNIIEVEDKLIFKYIESSFVIDKCLYKA
jgi:hypothetical protein